MLRKSVPTAYFVFSIPFALLLTAAALRIVLQREWTWWQMDAGTAPELVGRSLLGANLHDPAIMRAWSTLWGTVAGFTLLVCLLLFGATRSWYTVPWLNGSRMQPLVCRFSALAPWIALFLFPLFTAELIAFSYLVEILFNGSVMYMGPAFFLILTITGLAFPFAFRGVGEVDAPPLRVNGSILDEPSQPEFFDLLHDTAPGLQRRLSVAATLAPPLDVLHGRSQFDQTVLNGSVLLIPLSLVRATTLAEFRCVIAQACLPLGWAPGAWMMIEIAGAGRSLAQRITTAMRDSTFARIVPGVFPALGLALDLARWQPDSSAWTIPPNLETDRAIAARFGAVDLARAILKGAVQQILWPQFLYAMVARWKDASESDATRVLELGREFQLFLEPGVVHEAKEKLAVTEGDLSLPARLANLGFSTPDTWPALDFNPPEPAFALLRNPDVIERDLTAAERARFVSIPNR